MGELLLHLGPFLLEFFRCLFHLFELVFHLFLFKFKLANAPLSFPCFISKLLDKLPNLWFIFLTQIWKLRLAPHNTVFFHLLFFKSFLLLLWFTCIWCFLWCLGLGRTVSASNLLILDIFILKIDFLITGFIFF